MERLSFSFYIRDNLDHVQAIFDESLDVLHYDIPEQDKGLAYLHCEMNESLMSIPSVVQISEFIMEK